MIRLFIVLVLYKSEILNDKPELLPLFNTTWALSILGGPFAASLLWALHTVPFFLDPLPTASCLIIEITGDFIVMCCWLAEVLVTALLWSSSSYRCYDSVTSNSVADNSTILHYMNSNDSSFTNFNNMSSSDHSLWSNVSTAVVNASLNLTNSTTNIATICPISTSLYVKVVSLEATLGFLFFASLMLDIYGYMKGVYW
jgi:hypothetical protein